VDFLAKKFGVKGSAVKIITGETKPVKQVRISGMLVGVLERKLETKSKKAK
jgi:uncharacterized protein YggU (UPF0235/DUF167 family)